MLICGNPMGSANAVTDAESAGLSWAFGVVWSRKTIESEACLVDTLPGRNACRLVQSEDLSHAWGKR